MNPVKDKELEQQRYDNRAVTASKSFSIDAGEYGGPASIPRVLRSPYECYEATLKEVLKPNSVVLEIGSGTGEFTGVLLRSGAKLVASDISPRSLELLHIRYADKFNLSSATCDLRHGDSSVSRWHVRRSG